MYLFDIVMRLDDLFHRVHPINDRLYLARLDQFLEQEQVFDLVAAIRVNVNTEVDGCLLTRSFRL